MDTEEIRKEAKKPTSFWWDFFHRANRGTWYWRIMVTYILLYAGTMGIQTFLALVDQIDGPKWDAMASFDHRKIYLNVTAAVMLIIIAFLNQTASSVKEEKKKLEDQETAKAIEANRVVVEQQTQQKIVDSKSGGVPPSAV